MIKENITQEGNPDRRDFLKMLGGATVGGAALAMPGMAKADSRFHIDPNWPIRKIWRRVRRAFILDGNSVYMNIGTTGSTPRPVLKKYNRYNRLVAKYPWNMAGEWGRWPYMNNIVKTIAPQFGANDDEIILSRNTTDGMCTILGGLNLQPGDEILTTHHEHVAAVSPLTVAAQRFGVNVRYLEIPVFATSSDQFVDVFRNAVSPETRLIVFSHITYKTGTRLPAQRICREVAIPNGIPTLIDGAHTIGMLDLDFHAIDCDFYAGSGHKWQCGPGATGILYVRDNLNRLKNYWPDRDPVYFAINSSLYPYIPFLGLQNALQYIGNDNYPAKRALGDSCAMWQNIGRDRIETRVLELGDLCKQQIQNIFGDDVTMYSPSVAELSSGLTSFNPFSDQGDGVILKEFRDRLREDYGFIIRTTDFHINNGGPKVHALRISTHIFHNEPDVLGLVNAMYLLYRDMS